MPRAWRPSRRASAVATPCRRPATCLRLRHLNKPQEVIGKAFGENLARAGDGDHASWCACSARRGLARRPALRPRRPGAERGGADRERAQDAAGLLARPARWCCAWPRACRRCATTRPASSRCRPSLARESLQVFAPLANRLGIWEIKWSWRGPGLSLPRARYLLPRGGACWTKSAPPGEPTWRRCGASCSEPALAEGRDRRAGAAQRTSTASSKMRGKSLGFDQVYDLRALRIIVPSVPDCYQALSLPYTAAFTPGARRVRRLHRPAQAQRYQSLHTIVRDARPGRGGADPHPSHARPRRNRRGRALGLQGAGHQRAMRAWPPRRPTRPRSPCCASCWPGAHYTSRAPTGRAVRRTASTCSRRMPPSSSCRGRHASGFRQPHTDLGLLPRRAHRWRRGAAEHAPGERADGGGDVVA